MKRTEGYRPAVLFIIRFLGSYLAMSTLYGVFVEYHAPDADPITVFVSMAAGEMLSFFYSEIEVAVVPSSLHVGLFMSGMPVVNVFEGCNGVNVFVVYLAFLFAFRSQAHRTASFVMAGLVIIFATNLARVALLFGVALKFPDQLYFFHKYFFTAIIYCVVFAIWYLWVKSLRVSHGVEN